MSIEQVRRLTGVASATIVALSPAASALAQDVSYHVLVWRGSATKTLDAKASPKSASRTSPRQ